MSGFSRDHLVEKLDGLQDTMNSITSICRYFLFYKRYSKEAVQIWLEQLYTTQSSAKKIAYLHLCNDIVQNSVKRSKEFVNDFAPVLPAAFACIASKLPAELLRKVVRVLDVWEERGIYHKKAIDAIRKEVGLLRAQSTQRREHRGGALNAAPATVTEGQGSPGVLALLSELMAKLEVVKSGLIESDVRYKQLPASVRSNSLRSAADVTVPDLNAVTNVVDKRRSLLGEELKLRSAIVSECQKMIDHYMTKVSGLSQEISSMESTLSVLRGESPLAQVSADTGFKLTTVIPPMPPLPAQEANGNASVPSAGPLSATLAAETSHSASVLDSSASQAFLSIVGGSLDDIYANASKFDGSSSNAYSPADPNEE